MNDEITINIEDMPKFNTWKEMMGWLGNMEKEIRASTGSEGPISFNLSLPTGGTNGR